MYITREELYALLLLIATIIGIVISAFNNKKN